MYKYNHNRQMEQEERWPEWTRDCILMSALPPLHTHTHTPHTRYIHSYPSRRPPPVFVTVILHKIDATKFYFRSESKTVRDWWRGDREGWKMAIHYLTTRLSQWAGSQTVPSCLRNVPNAYKYICWGVCGWAYIGYNLQHCNKSTQTMALTNKNLSNM